MPSIRKMLRVAVVTTALAGLCALGASAVSPGEGTVNSGGLRLRSEPNTRSTILATAPKGAAVQVLEAAGDGWYKVEYRSIPGYMFGEYLDIVKQVEDESANEQAETEQVSDPVEADPTETGEAAAQTVLKETDGQTESGGGPEYGLVNTFPDYLNCRSGPGTGYDIVTTLAPRTVVTLTGKEDGWYSIEYQGLTGYVSDRYIIPCDAAGTRTDLPEGGSSELGQQVVDYAMNFLGCPYVSGGSGPYSFDCSGFTSFVYAHFGYSLYRTQTDQLKNGAPVTPDVAYLQPGDLIFFDNNPAVITGHVGIYVGDGQFIHASTNKYQVELRSLYDWNGYYIRIMKFARRIV